MSEHRSFSERLRAASSPTRSAGDAAAEDARLQIFGGSERRAPRPRDPARRRPPPLSAYERLDAGLLALTLRPRRLAVLIALGAAIFYLHAQMG